jgi:hypothetical protein
MLESLNRSQLSVCQRFHQMTQLFSSDMLHLLRILPKDSSKQLLIFSSVACLHIAAPRKPSRSQSHQDGPESPLCSAVSAERKMISPEGKANRAGSWRTGTHPAAVNWGVRTGVHSRCRSSATGYRLRLLVRRLVRRPSFHHLHHHL